MKTIHLSVAVLFSVLTGCAETPLPVVPPAPDPPPSIGVVEAPPPGPTETPDADFRKGAPTAGPDVAFVAPKVEDFRLKNGMRVLLVERHDLPIVVVQVVATSGAEQAAEGVAGFAGALLFSGTKTRTALTISDDLQGLGADFGGWADFDRTSLWLQVLSPKLAEALPILADIAQSATFPKDEVERERSRRLTSIAQEKDSPQRLLGNVVASTLYPAAHPYSHPLLGSEASVKKITPADLQAYHRGVMQPDRITITVAGDVTRASIEGQLEKAFAGFTGKAGPARTLPNPPSMGAKDPRIILIDRPGSTQSNVAVAVVGVPRGTKDYDALLVMNTLLGGQFSSRLNMNLREKHAYTSGAGSSFDMRHGAGPFTAKAAIVREATAPAIKEMFAEIERMQTELVTPEELADAKSSLVKRLPAMFETASETGGTLAGIAVYGLSLEEYTTRPTRLARITAEDVKRVAAKYLRPATLRVVIVGDAARIRESVEGLPYGPVDVRGADADKKKAAASHDAAGNASVPPKK